MVKQDSRLPRALCFPALFVFHNVRATHQETALVVLLEILPELSGLDLLGDLGRSEVVLLGGAAGEVDE